MEWHKKGLIYSVRGRHEWNRSHAQLPIVDATMGEIWRIYFATRDSKNRSNISYIEVERGRPENILYEHNAPLLPLGDLGTFDESGLMPVCLVSGADRKYLYYAGWTLRQTVPYHNAIGLAISEDEGKTFRKLGEGPLFDSLPGEPYFTGTAHVMMEEQRWRMWYQSCTGWKVFAGRPEPFYHIKYAESVDGISWARHGIVAIDYADEREGGICSASVLKEKDGYKMWYSFRAAQDYRNNRDNSYRIGYAESLDGLTWRRQDRRAGIDVSAEGWDAEMIAYPYVLQHAGRKYMFYNGNGFGATGFGYAISDH